VIQLNPRTVHLLGVENVTFLHPTYFHERYMTGTVTKTTGGVATTLQIDTSYFDAYLKGMYVTIDTLTPSVLDGVLFNLLKTFKTIMGETTSPLVYLDFDGYDPADFIYNNFGLTSAYCQLMDWDDEITGGYASAANVTLAMITKHQILVNSLMTRRFKFYIVNNSSTTDLSFKGPFSSMYGLDPDLVYTINKKTGQGTTYDYEECNLPLYGHDYMALASNIVSNSMGAMNGEKMVTSDVLAILSTPNYPGQTEAYIPHHAGGKVELMSDTIDSIELRFTDEIGNPILSLENFIVTLTISVYPENYLQMRE